MNSSALSTFIDKNRQIISLSVFILFALILNFDCISFIRKVTSDFGHYVYPLDDTYIHLSISKNLAQHGIWGITRYGFSSTSSSPLFTVLIAFLMKLFGNSEFIPLYLNFFLGNLLVFVLYQNFKKQPVQLAILYILFFVAVMMQIQIVTGMEHMLHIFLISVSWIYFYRWFQSDFENQRFRNIFYLTVPFLCIARYESLFFITAIIAFLLLQKKYKDSALIAFLSLIPVFVFGIYAISNGGHFFPNSLLKKGNYELSDNGMIRYVGQAVKIIFYTYPFYFFLLTLLSLLLTVNSGTEKKTGFLHHLKRNGVFGIIFITVIAHLVFAKTEWLFRYDAYLIGLLSITILFVWNRIAKVKKSRFVIWSVGILVFLTAVSFALRFERASMTMNYASKNIHDQQILMSKFLAKYYNHSDVIANDIGAITYFTDIKLTDLQGLGSTDILDLKLTDKNKLASYVKSKNFDVMLIYVALYPDQNFENVVKVAELTIQDNIICGDDTVTFYVPKTADRTYVLNALEQFRKEEIPKDVELKIYY